MLVSFKKSLMVNIGLSAIVALLLIALILWFSFDIKRRVVEIKNIKENIAFHSKSVEALAAFKKDFKEAEKQKSFLNTILPIQDKLINFPKDINSLAKRYDINLGFSFGKETAGTAKEPGYISFTLIASSSSFDNWIDFIKAMENSQYLIKFDSFNLVKDEEKFRSAINGKVFSQ